MKKNIVIIILSVLILCLSGYLVYDKVIEKDEVIKKEENIIKETITDKESYNIGNNLYNYGINVLWCLEYKYSDEYVENLGYEILNFEEVKNKFTDDNLVQHSINQEFTTFDYEIVKHENKYYDISQCGRGADQSYKSTSLNLKQKGNEIIIFDAVSQYCVEGLAYPYDESECTDTKSITHEFIIEKNNGQWKISYMTNPK